MVITPAAAGQCASVSPSFCPHPQTSLACRVYHRLAPSDQFAAAVSQLLGETCLLRMGIEDIAPRTKPNTEPHLLLQKAIELVNQSRGARRGHP